MNAELKISRRTALLIMLVDMGLVDYSSSKKAGGVFTVTPELGVNMILDSANHRPRIGFPKEMGDLALSSWLGWRVCDNALALVGYMKGMEFSFEFRVPIGADTVERLTQYSGELTVGVLNIDVKQRVYAMVDTINYKKVAS